MGICMLVYIPIMGTHTHNKNEINFFFNVHVFMYVGAPAIVHEPWPGCGGQRTARRCQFYDMGPRMGLGLSGLGERAFTTKPSWLLTGGFDADLTEALRGSETRAWVWASLFLPSSFFLICFFVLFLQLGFLCRALTAGAFH